MLCGMSAIECRFSYGRDREYVLPISVAYQTQSIYYKSLCEVKFVQAAECYRFGRGPCVVYSIESLDGDSITVLLLSLLSSSSIDCRKY